MNDMKKRSFWFCYTICNPAATKHAIKLAAAVTLKLTPIGLLKWQSSKYSLEVSAAHKAAVSPTCNI